MGGTTLELHLTATGPPALAGAHTNDNAYLYTIASARIDNCRLELFDNGVSFGAFTATHAEPFRSADRVYRVSNTGMDTATFATRLNDTVVRDQLRVLLSFRARCLGFFHHIVKQMAYAANDGRNFADPGGAAGAILGSVTRTATRVNPTDTQWQITHHGENVAVVNLPVALTAHRRVDDSTRGLGIHLDLPNSGRTGLQQNDILRALIAADWSEWFDRLDPANPRAVDGTWQANIRAYMLRFVPLTRGAALMDEAQRLGQVASAAAILNLGLTDTERQRATALAVRNEVDRFLITANPWGQSTNVGAYPVAIHTVLAVAYARFAAMPINQIREMRRTNVLTAAQKEEMAAQVGMGNCAEHGQITYRVIRALMIADNPTEVLLRCVISSGYANIDHAFVVGGEPPQEVIDAFVHSNHHPAHLNQGDRTNIWDARLAFDAGGGGDGRWGWICDPYLAVDQIAASFRALSAGPRLRHWLDWYNTIHPVPLMAPPTRADHDNPGHATHIHIIGFCDLAPTVATIAPTGGALAGNTAVTITGTHFDAYPGYVDHGNPMAGVLIGGVAATHVVVANSRQMTARTGAHVAGQVHVVVRNPAVARDTSRDGTLANGYTYRAAPTVAGVAPNSGTAAGNVDVVITGTGFLAPVTVTFDGAAATNVNVDSPTQIRARTSAHLAGPVPVVVENADRQQGTLPNAFTYT